MCENYQLSRKKIGRFARNLVFKPRRLIHYEVTTDIGPSYPVTAYVLDIKTADELKSNVDTGLDTIYNGILHGDPFVYPAEHEMQIPPGNRH